MAVKADLQLPISTRLSISTRFEAIEQVERFKASTSLRSFPALEAQNGQLRDLIERVVKKLSNIFQLNNFIKY